MRWLLRGGLLAALFLILAPLMLSAALPLSQDSATVAGMAAAIPNPLCLMYAPLIALATLLLKQIPFIGKSPKAIAFVLSLAVTLSPLFHGTALPIAQLVTCVLVQLSGAVATHEIVLAPAAQAIASS